MSGSNKSKKVTILVLIFLLLSAGIFGVSAEEWHLRVYYGKSVVNGRVLNSGNPEVRVGPGERISGFLEVVVDNHRGGPWITPIIGTASWTRGKFECIALDAKTGVSTHRYQFDLTAPIIPGIYYIGVFAGWMYTCDEVASNDHPSLFGDGDDVWDMPRQRWEEILVHGHASSGSYLLPGRAIRIVVEERFITRSSSSKMDLSLVALHLMESFGTWGVTSVDLESTFCGVETLRMSDGLALIDMEKTARWIAAHQREDGSFSSLKAAYLAVATLKALNRLDLIDREGATRYILEHALGMIDPLWDGFYMIEALSALGALEAISDEISTKVKDEILSKQGNDGGWGNNIVRTYHALRILNTLGELRPDVLERALRFIQSLYDPETGYYKHSALDIRGDISSTYYAVAALKMLGRVDMIEEKTIQSVITDFDFSHYVLDDVCLNYWVSFVLDSAGKFAPQLREQARNNVIRMNYAHSIGAFRRTLSGWLGIELTVYPRVNSLRILLGEGIFAYKDKIGALRSKLESGSQADIIMSWMVFGNVPSDVRDHFIKLARDLMRNDGGFSFERGSRSDIRSTYMMLEALSRLGSLGQVIIDREKTIEFILSYYNPSSGTFERCEHPPLLRCSFYALSSLKILNALDRIDRDRIINYISWRISSENVAMHDLYYAVKSLMVLGEELRYSDVVRVIEVIRSRYVPAGYFGSVDDTAMAIELLSLLRPYGVKIEDMKLWFLVSISVSHLDETISTQKWIEDGGVIEFSPAKTIIEFKENERLVLRGWRLSDRGVINQAHVHLTVFYPLTLNMSAIWVKQYYVDVKSEFGEVAGTGWYDENSEAVISLSDETILFDHDERLVFTGWNVAPELNGIDLRSKTINFIVDKPYVIEANWKRQYYVKVIDAIGIAVGGGWYDDGSTASVYVENILAYDVHDENMRYRFVGWSGDCVGGECDLENVKFKVVKPMILEAKWLKEYKVTLRALPQWLASTIFHDLEEVWVVEGTLFFYVAPDEIKFLDDLVYVFKGWYDDRARIITTDVVISLMVNEPMTIIAVYEPRRDIVMAGYAPSYSLVLLLATMILLPMLVAGLVWAGRVARARRMREIDEKMRTLESMYREGKISKEAYEIIRGELEQERQKY